MNNKAYIFLIIGLLFTLIIICVIFLYNKYKKNKIYTDSSLSSLKTISSDSDSKYMCCDDGTICGVLVIESGLGRNKYRHGDTGLHGLWVQSSKYGNSETIKPDNENLIIDSDDVICPHVNEDWHKTDKYKDSFLYYEWNKHGKEAGGSGSSNYFNNACKLSKKITDILNSIRKNIKNDDELCWKCIKNAVYTSKYGKYLWQFDEGQRQIFFAVYSDDKGSNWNFRDVSKYDKCYNNSNTKKCEKTC
jgi:hypothetical protein